MLDSLKWCYPTDLGSMACAAPLWDLDTYWSLSQAYLHYSSLIHVASFKLFVYFIIFTFYLPKWVYLKIRHALSYSHLEVEYLSHFVEFLWGHDCFKSIKNSKNEAVLPNPQSYKIQFVSSCVFERLWRLSLLSVRLILGTLDLFPSRTTEPRMLGKPLIGAPVFESFIFQ